MQNGHVSHLSLQHQVHAEIREIYVGMIQSLISLVQELFKEDG